MTGTVPLDRSAPRRYPAVQRGSLELHFRVRLLPAVLQRSGEVRRPSQSSGATLNARSYHRIASVSSPMFASRFANVSIVVAFPGRPPLEHAALRFARRPPARTPALVGRIVPRKDAHNGIPTAAARSEQTTTIPSRPNVRCNRPARRRRRATETLPSSGRRPRPRPGAPLTASFDFLITPCRTAGYLCVSR